MHPARQILCIHLPHWSITRRYRRLRKDQIGTVVVVQTTGQRRQVIDASDEALSRGVRLGISAAEARIFCGPMRCLEHDPKGDRRVLEALGRWLIRFTPLVASGWDDMPDNTAALFLDLTGCERLFGGTKKLVERIREALARFGIPAGIAVAPTPGAAWAFAFSGGLRTRLIDAHSFTIALSALSLETLRLESKALAGLFQLGLQRVGELLALPRDQLPARFGPSLLKRLDQLTGAAPEPLTRLVYDPPVSARIEFESPVDSLEDIWLIFEKLLSLVLVDLARRNHGVRQLQLIFTPDLGWGRATETRTIPLSRPHRDRATLLNLIRCETERVDCENGFIRFQLDIPLHEAISDEQNQLFDQQAAEERMEWERLFQRLSVHLGAEAVIQPELVESYLPERAWRPATESISKPTTTCPTARPPPPRPLTLFETPMEIRVVCEPSDNYTGRPRQFTWRGNVYRLTHAVGPERIAGEWWRGHYRTRDYYDAEDDTGQRFWLFRVLGKGEVLENASSRWFLHGRFD